jgi:RNA polymerase sigma-70 factor (ECF subfamily)
MQEFVQMAANVSVYAAHLLCEDATVMQQLMPGTDSGVEQLWEPNREHVRRLLISLTRDLDLAEDLMQETYLDARSGLAGYRGGDARAWLAAIARNAFYAYARRRSVRMEMPGEVDDSADSRSRNGSTEHLTAIALRQAISELTSTVRMPLLMKHYGGFTYEEIGQKLGCPVGTARRRVWDAVRKLRKALEAREEAAAVECRNLRGTRLLDYLYGGLPDKQSREIAAHLEQCADCREEARALRELIAGMDHLEGDDRCIRIVDLDAAGASTEYSWWSMTNGSGETAKINWCTCNKDCCVDAYLLQGREVPIRVLPCSDSQYSYEGTLPRPVEPGGRVDSFMVIRPTGDDGRAQKQPDGTWRYRYGTTPNSARDWAFVMVMRLPRGAEVISAEPEPSEVRSKGATTLIWRSLLASFHKEPRPWQFECVVDYRLDAGATKEEKPQPACDKSQFIWAPEVAFEIADLPWTGAGERAHDLFVRADDLPRECFRVWFKLGLALYDGGHYDEALVAFGRVGMPDMGVFLIYPFAARVWQGHICDLLGRREEALAHYQEALDLKPGEGTMRHDQYDMTVNRSWAEERLKTPFERR